MENNVGKCRGNEKSGEKEFSKNKKKLTTSFQEFDWREEKMTKRGLENADGSFWQQIWFLETENFKTLLHWHSLKKLYNFSF